MTTTIPMVLSATLESFWSEISFFQQHEKMVKKRVRKEEKRREKAMARMIEHNTTNEQEDDDLFEDDSGICPCAARLTPDMLCANLSQRGGVHVACEKCNEQCSSKQGNKQKGGKKAKGKGRNHRDSSLPTGGCVTGGGTFYCLTCGFCGCEGHCNEHLNDAKDRSKKGHRVFMKNNLFGTDGSFTVGHRGKCFDCNVNVSERFNEPDAIAEDTVQGCLVDFGGYVVNDDANEGYRQCCLHIIEVASSGDTASLPQPQWKKGKRCKQSTSSSKFTKKQRQQRARGNARYDRAGVSKGAKEAGLKGLQNLGNTCFFNSVIQAVNNTPGMAAAITAASSGGKIGSFTTAVYALMLKLHSATDSVTAQLRMLLSELHRTGPQFAGYGQHDAHELTRFMSERVELEYISNAKKSEIETDPQSNPFFNIFHGIMLSDVRCTTCGQTSNVEEPFYDISLALSHTIDASLELFFTDELLEGYKHPCKHCNEVEFAAVKARQEREKAQMIETIQQEAEERTAVSLNELLEVYESDKNKSCDENSDEESIESFEELEEDDDEYSPQSSKSNSPSPSISKSPKQSAATKNITDAESSDKLTKSTVIVLDNLSNEDEASNDKKKRPTEGDLNCEVCAIPDSQASELRESGMPEEKAAEESLPAMEIIDTGESVESTEKVDIGTSAEKINIDSAEKVDIGNSAEKVDIGNSAEKVDIGTSAEKVEFDSELHKTSVTAKSAKQISASSSQPNSNDSATKVKKITTDASKQYSIKKLPRTLVIHLKRFAFCRSSCAFVKDNKKIDIPSTLDLSSWLTDDYEGSSKYQISSTIEHQGEVGYGHYIAHTLTQNKWFECNDSLVTESSYSAATRCPYLVFYSSIE